MASAHNFRSALNGFNRDDVVKYIEFMNSKHTTELNQLRSQIDSLKNELVTRVFESAPNKDTEEALEASNLRCEELEQECAQLRQQLEELQSQPAPSLNIEELEAYRRAERVERLAQERAVQIRNQANEILADASAKVSEASVQISTMTGQVQTQLDHLKIAVSGSKQVLQEAADAMNAIRTEE